MTRVWSDGAADETRRGLADRRYRRRARYDPRFCAGGGRDRLSGDRAARPCARRQPREPAGLDSAARPLNRPLPRSLRAVRVSRRGHENRGFFDAGADPAAAPDRARREAGGMPRCIVGRAVPARYRGRLERGRIHRPQRGFSQSRPPLGGAGRTHAGAMAGAACRVQGQVAHDRGCRDQPATGLGQGAALVRRTCGGHVAAHRQMGRWLDAIGVRTG